FTKMHGLGNNYVYIDCFKQPLEESILSDLAIRLADQKRGIGSDGMILICPSERADVKMRIFNADGSEGMNCGNGLRCVAKYAYERELVKEQRFTIETLSRTTEATVFFADYDQKVVEVVEIDMGEPELSSAAVHFESIQSENVIQYPISFENETYHISTVSMGNPHAVIVVDDIESAPLDTFGKWLSSASLFTNGVNVEFIQKVSEHYYHFRVWERGSGITEACGTGACAAAVVATTLGMVPKDEPVTIALSGGELTIVWRSVDNHVIMRGEAQIICDGIFYY
ncbi:MAG: diaminopimelate epimerase, partial [Bacilli bacterium]